MCLIRDGVTLSVLPVISSMRSSQRDLQSPTSDLQLLRIDLRLYVVFRQPTNEVLYHHLLKATKHGRLIAWLSQFRWLSHCDHDKLTMLHNESHHFSTTTPASGTSVSDDHVLLRVLKLTSIIRSSFLMAMIDRIGSV